MQWQLCFYLYERVNKKLLDDILQFVLCKRSFLMIIMVHYDLHLTGISFCQVLDCMTSTFIHKAWNLEPNLKQVITWTILEGEQYLQEAFGTDMGRENGLLQGSLMQKREVRPFFCTWFFSAIFLSA